MRLLFYEFHKIFVKQKVYIFVFIFLIIKIIFLCSMGSYSVETTDQNKKFYLGYLSKINGKLSKQKENYILNEKNHIDQVNSEKNNIVNKYLNAEINEREYILKIKDINNTLEKSEAFKIVYDQYLYIKKNPQNRYFMYTNGWTNLMSSEYPDIIIILLLLIIITPIFTIEYEKDMVALILTSKKGKWLIPIFKIIVASILTILTTVIFFVVQYIYCNIKYGLIAGDFPLQSVPFFGTSTHHLSLIHTYLYICLIKLCGFLVFTYLIILIAVITKKTVLTLFISLSSILIPYFIYFNDSIKYKLPLPIGFIIGNGYIRGNDNSSILTKGATNFVEISRQIFILQTVYMATIAIISIITSIFIFSKFKYKRWGKI